MVCRPEIAGKHPANHFTGMETPMTNEQILAEIQAMREAQDAIRADVRAKAAKVVG